MLLGIIPTLSALEWLQGLFIGIVVGLWMGDSFGNLCEFDLVIRAITSIFGAGMGNAAFIL